MAIFPHVITAKNIERNDGNPLYEDFQPSLYIPTNAQLTSSVQALTGRYITELYSPKRRVYNEWIKMLEKDPIAAFCAAIKVLRAQITFGEYTHPNKDYQQFIRDNLSNMEESFRNIVARLASAMTYGTSIAEINFTSNKPGFRSKWMLRSINTLDIRNISVRGKLGRICEFGYRDRYNNTTYINAKKCIHVTNTDIIPFNTDLIWGSADCEKALNWYKLRQLVATEFSIASKNNAQGILWGKTNSTQRMQLYDADDKLRVDQTGKAITVSKQKALYMQLKELENNDLIVTDNDTNLEILQTTTGERFWEYAFDLIEKNLALSFGVPASLFREGSSATFGNTGLSQNHKSMLDSSVESVVQTMREELINKAIKPLLVWEFGEAKDYGKFEFLADESATDRNARISTLLSASASGVIPPDDQGLQTEVRKALGLPPQSEPEKADAEKLKNMDLYLKWVNSVTSAENAKVQAVEAQAKKDEIQQQVPNVNQQIEKQDTPDNQSYP